MIKLLFVFIVEVCDYFFYYLWFVEVLYCCFDRLILVLLFIVQVSLVAKRRVRVHQRLGIAGGVLAALVVVVGVLTALYAAAREVTPGPSPLAFLVVPLGDMLVFAVLIGLALYFRRKLQVHKRLMLLAAINLLTPAIARIP